MRNMATNPPTNPPIAPPAASSNPSGKSSAKARASRIPAANAAEYDRPLALSSPPNRATRLAPENPTAASTATKMALTGAAPGSAPPASPRRSPSTLVFLPPRTVKDPHPRTAGVAAVHLGASRCDVMTSFSASSSQLLAARGAPSVDLDAVRARLEPEAGKALRVKRALVELGDVAARFADGVVVMVLGELVARPVAQVEAA